jgi:hypothetical protein
MDIGGVDIGAGEPEESQQFEADIVQLVSRDFQRLREEILAERPLVEDELDVEGRFQTLSSLKPLARSEP